MMMMMMIVAVLGGGALHLTVLRLLKGCMRDDVALCVGEMNEFVNL